MEFCLKNIFDEHKGSVLNVCVTSLFKKYPPNLVEQILFDLISNEISKFINNLLKTYSAYEIETKKYINSLSTTSSSDVALVPTQIAYDSTNLWYESAYMYARNNSQYSDFNQLSNVIDKYTKLLEYYKSLQTILSMLELCSQKQGISNINQLHQLKSFEECAKGTNISDLIAYRAIKNAKNFYTLEPQILLCYIKQQPNDDESIEIVDSLKRSSVFNKGIFPIWIERVNEWDNADIIWRYTSKGIFDDTLTRLSEKTYGLINHFTGSMELAKKNNLLRYLSDNRIREIAPRTFIGSGVNQGLMNKLTSFGNKLWIVKPMGQWGGTGIQLMSVDELKKINTKSIIQEYIEHPFLYENGHKFDIRIHVLVTTFPNGDMCVYLQWGGLIRISSRPYDPNSKDPMVFLTNNSIHKKYARCPEDILQDLFNVKGLNYEKVLSDIQNSVQKLFRNTEQVLNPKGYTSSFQLFGLDFILDGKQKPYLLEVNSTPFVDYIKDGGKWSKKIKSKMLRDMWIIVFKNRLGESVNNTKKKYKFVKIL